MQTLSTEFRLKNLKRTPAMATKVDAFIDAMGEAVLAACTEGHEAHVKWTITVERVRPDTPEVA